MSLPNHPIGQLLQETTSPKIVFNELYLILSLCRVKPGCYPAARVSGTPAAGPASTLFSKLVSKIPGLNSKDALAKGWEIL